MEPPAANEGQQGRIPPRTSEGVSLALQTQVQASGLEYQGTISVLSHPDGGSSLLQFWGTYNMARAHGLLTQFLQETPNLPHRGYIPRVRLNPCET